jgi:hypothetical protein
VSGELPDMDALLRESERREKKTSLVLGSIMLAGAAAVLFGSRALFHGAMQITMPAVGVLGLVLIVRGLWPSKA